MSSQKAQTLHFSFHHSTQPRTLCMVFNDRCVLIMRRRDIKSRLSLLPSLCLCLSLPVSLLSNSP